MAIHTYGPAAVDWEQRVDLTRLRAERQRMEGSQRPVVANSRSLSGAGMRVPVLLATTHKCGESTRGPIFLASDRLLA